MPGIEFYAKMQSKFYILILFLLIPIQQFLVFFKSLYPPSVRRGGAGGGGYALRPAGCGRAFRGLPRPAYGQRKGFTRAASFTCSNCLRPAVIVGARHLDLD